MAKDSDEPIGVVKAAASVYKHRSKKKRVLLEVVRSMSFSLPTSHHRS
jgi:hypothetical protein